METLKREKRVFLEVSRIRKDKHKLADRAKDHLKFVAWCERCQVKICLVPKSETEYQKLQTDALHVQINFNGKLLVCRNSVIRKTNDNQ